MSRVVVLQRVLPHYRVAFFDQLHAELAGRGIQLQLIYGQERDGTVPRTVVMDRPWTRRITNRYFDLRGTELVWQPVTGDLRGADLIAIEQANRLLLNYLLLARKGNGGARVALWGHGTNLQRRQEGAVGRLLRQKLFDRSDWWFAYTELSARIVADSGFPLERTTVVNNAIDTAELVAGRSQYDQSRLQQLRGDLGICGDHVAVYCGGLYAHKRLQFLLDACVAIRQEIPDFHLVLVGDGPDRHLVERAARAHAWVHYVGEKYGVERIPYFLLSRLMLMPGPVGLAIVDSFVLGVPMVTTDNGMHGPEIAYLQNGVNGLMTRDDLADFSGRSVELLKRDDVHRRLVAGCEEAARQYTLAAMVQRYADGVSACLERPAK